MFTRLDDILFPNRVEVYDFHEINKFFYPIFKCGSTTLYEVTKEKGFKTLINEQIKRLDVVDIFIRNPRERYISGVQTYFHQNPELDVNTVKHYLKQGIILNRHFSHQFQWIINLSRYLKPDGKIHLHSIDMLSQYTNNCNIVKDKNTNIDVSDIITSPNLELAFSLDQIILDELTGDSWTIKQMFDYLQERNPTAYSSIIGKVQHVLPKV